VETGLFCVGFVLLLYGVWGKGRQGGNDFLKALYELRLDRTRAETRSDVAASWQKGL